MSRAIDRSMAARGGIVAYGSLKIDGCRRLTAFGVEAPVQAVVIGLIRRGPRLVLGVLLACHVSRQLIL
jgi:hypothetical protein